ncbi:hypothetical protein ACIBEJ_10250 [Nonomuraea sp. NPDC050790]|uniref:hypothetical protein n=1 Tax=Nonomuraea sp. NPDC050790 TaxID=3364371 RepID=UPI0037A01FEA
MKGNLSGWMRQVLHALVLLLAVAAGARIAWELLVPTVPMLVSLAIVLAVLWLALFGRRP